jgi:hypothetical protein
LDDKGKLKLDKKTAQMLELAKEAGQTQIVEMLKKQVSSHPQRIVLFIICHIKLIVYLNRHF